MAGVAEGPEVEPHSALTYATIGIAISARNVGSFWVSLIVSFWPLATMPETDDALPAMRASAPTTECGRAC